MPLTVAFSTTQVIGNPSGIVLNDLTTGSDVTATSRRIIIQTATGQYLNASGLSNTLVYTEWPLADGTSITLDYLTEDMAIYITLRYVNVSGGTVAEDVELRGFKLYNENFYYELTMDEALQNQPPPMIIQDSNYYTNKMILRVNIDSGDNAITYGNDIVTAQNAYSRATYMRLNSSDYF